MKAMVLAAGLGTRLRPYTLQRPKPLFPVLGKPLLLKTIERLKSAGFSPIIVNVHHLGEQIVKLLNGENDVIIQKEPFELGTGGGLRMALDHFDDTPVLVVNGDIYHHVDYAWVYRKHLESDAPVTMVLHDYPRFNNVIVSGGAHVRGFCRNTQESCLNLERGDTVLLAFTGIQVLDPALLKGIPEGVFYNIIDLYDIHLNESGLIRSLITESYWRDIGTPSDYLALHHDLLLNRQKSKYSLDESAFCIGDNVEMGEGTELVDWGYVGDGVKIGNYVYLERAVVWDGVEIPDGSRIVDKVVT